MTSPIRLALISAVAWLIVGIPVSAGDWKYVISAESQSAAGGLYAVPQALFLSETKPEDLRDEDAPYRGKRRRYAQLRYGSPNSIRVACVIDELEDGTIDLYVDANRNRTIEKRDKVAGAGPEWELPLDVAIPHDDEVDLHRRRVSLRLGTSGRTLAAATLGSMEGAVTLEGRTLAARRVDGDANGSFADAGDRLWVDRNGDGVWDPFTEQFAFSAILRIGDERYAARSDTLGEKLTLEPLTGSGAVRLVLPASLTQATADSKAEPTIAVTLVGRDGTAVLVSGVGKPAEVPGGEYQIQIVALSAVHKEDGRRWNFLFSACDGRQRPWHAMQSGATLDLDPIGALDLAIDLEGDKKDCKPGELLTVRPRLYTGDGLLINACYWGTEGADEKNHSKCTVALAGGPGDNRPPLDTRQSGFL